jgi:small ligand-binding sensory domain FIST
LSVFAARFGGGRVAGVVLDAERTDDGFAIGGWPDELQTRGTLLMLADPFTFPAVDFLRLCNAQVPDLEVIGGMASAAAGPGGNRLVLDDRILTTGAVGVMCSEDVPIRAVVSQGCRPIGMPLTITSAERNLAHELAGRPAMERLQEIVQAATDADRRLMREGLHVGIVVDEHRLDFERGDFLVRNLLGVDQSTGSLAISEPVEVGQTVQFQVRDAGAADEDLRCLLEGVTGTGALVAALHRSRPRCRCGRRAARRRADGRRVLRGRDGADRRPEFPARLHRQRRRLRLIPRGPERPGADRGGR